MLPIFLIDDPDEEQEIASMPGVKRMGINAAVKFLDPLVKIGLKSVLLFAVTAAEKVGANELFKLTRKYMVSITIMLNITGRRWISGPKESMNTISNGLYVSVLYR